MIHEIDARSHAVIGASAPLPIGKESIAIVGDQIWVGGYGSGSTPRLFHLDGSSLQPLATETSGADARSALVRSCGLAHRWCGCGPAAARAWPASTRKVGALLEQWPAVQGPVASVRGDAFAASDGSLDQLSLSGDCTG